MPLKLTDREEVLVTYVFEKFGDTLVEALGPKLRTAFAARDARIAALEASEKQLRYVGTFQKANSDSYRRNNFVTHGGSIWVALTDQPQHAPGDGGDWQLAVKGTR